MSERKLGSDLLDLWRDNVVMDNDVANFTEKQCLQLAQDYQEHSATDVSRVSGDWCSPTWDSFACWSAAPPGSLVARSCTVLLRAELDNVGEQQLTTQAGEAESFAFRLCTPLGWLQNTTNYNACIAALGDDQITGALPSGAIAIATIVSAFSVVSLIFLAASVFIFTYFSSLRCSRTRVHLNLVMALLVNSLLLTIITLPVVVNHHYDSFSPLANGDANSETIRGHTEKATFVDYRLPNVRNEPTACKISLCIKLYSSMASVNWMFVEGIQLHSRITTSIFQQEAPFKLYYFIGWGFPLILIVAWGVKMQEILPHSTCWEGYRSYDVVWLLTGPKLVVLLINFVFLMNIIRILVTRVKCVTAENKQFRKAMKATVLLFPLLGTTHLLYGISPQDYDEKLNGLYMIVNAVLQSSQGVFVSVIHCFMNSEVQTLLRNAYLRALIRRNPNRRSFLSNNATPSQTSAIFLAHSCSVSRRPSSHLQAYSSSGRHSRFTHRRSGQLLLQGHMTQTMSPQHNNNCSLHTSHNCTPHIPDGGQNIYRPYTRREQQHQHIHRRMQRHRQGVRSARSLSPFRNTPSLESSSPCRCSSASVMNIYRTPRNRVSKMLSVPVPTRRKSDEIIAKVEQKQHISNHDITSVLSTHYQTIFKL
ncbi:corticotropin-releasing factor receptor 1-like [Varroa jacobsoni]|uniref:corticotropin-releasing factor receptor 1-like n=1 Tax=Varroa jacobsoni TaxID=62625 RepID=UPI000BF3E2DF|nr:corticotropin-releasing factor receptor 1-like [Varroa jacobsoni]